jgi:F0F1-type ATP synthase membrane subunit b/b'
MLKAAEAERATAMKEAEEMLTRAKAEAERVAAAAQAEAQAAAERRERMAMDRIAAAEAGAIAEVRQAAADIATAATRTLLAETIDATHRCIADRKGTANWARRSARPETLSPFPIKAPSPAGKGLFSCPLIPLFHRA